MFPALEIWGEFPPALGIWGLNVPSSGVWGLNAPSSGILGGLNVSRSGGLGLNTPSSGRCRRGSGEGSRGQAGAAGRETGTHGLAPSFAANYTWHFPTLINRSLGTQARRAFSSLAPGRWAAISGGGVGDPDLPRHAPVLSPRDHLWWPLGNMASPAGGPSYQCSRLTGASQEQL